MTLVWSSPLLFMLFHLDVDARADVAVVVIVDVLTIVLVCVVVVVACVMRVFMIRLLMGLLA